ncbi:MAG: exodeoxyribonuclease VII small subunit [Oscillospiraceae bacterium]|nr:exodeoxyribonuclease VII small subunit [Oscillospiraceae bacterium]
MAEKTGAGETRDSMSFENMLRRLEEIVRTLEQGDVPLDRSLALYSEGAELIRRCTRELDEAEQTVVKLQKGPDGSPVELPFDTEIE